MPTARDLLTASLARAALAPASLALGSGFWLVASLLGGPPAALQDTAAALAQPLQERPETRADGAKVGAAALMGRPLFPPNPAAEPATLRLEGVALGAGLPAALVQAGDEPARWLRVGESVGGLTLSSIAATTVTLEGMAGEQTVPLGHASSADPSSAPVAASGAPAPVAVPLSVSRVRVSHDPWLADAPRR